MTVDEIAGGLSAEERRVLLEIALDNPPGSDFVMLPREVPSALLRAGLVSTTIIWPRGAVRKPLGISDLGRSVAAVLERAP